MYYIQYAHARICRMLEKAASTGLQFEVSAARSHAARLSLDAETEILAKLAAYQTLCYVLLMHMNHTK